MLIYAVTNFYGIAENGFQENTDAYDWIIASFINANMQRSSYPKLTIDDKAYLCFSYNELVSEVPFLGKHTKDYFRKKLNDMIKVGMLEKAERSGFPNAYRLSDRANNAMQHSKDTPCVLPPPPLERSTPYTSNECGSKYIDNNINIYKEKEINKEKETPSLVGKESELNPPDIGVAPPLVVTDNFEVFWKAYPNKKGKAGALAKWNVLKKQKTLPNIQVILNAIQSQKEWRNTAKQGEFRPEWKHPSTWLNQGCWDDEVEVQQNGKINIKGAMFPRSETFFYNGEYHAIALEAKLYNELKTRGEI
jgi:hypothetical protein